MPQISMIQLDKPCWYFQQDCQFATLNLQAKVKSFSPGIQYACYVNQYDNQSNAQVQYAPSGLENWELN